MPARASAVCLLAAALLLASPAAEAADLDDRNGYERYGQSSPYDDPRYRDLYADDPPRYSDRGEPYRDDRYGEPPPAGSYKDPPGSYRDAPYPTAPLPPPRYSEAPRYDERGCFSRRQVHARLTSGGWGDFHDIELRGRIAYVKARRPSGRLFDLEIDRCTGGIVSARPLGHQPPRPYAWGPPSRY